MKKKKKYKFKNIIIIILFILMIFSSFKMLYALSLLKGIETLIRFLISIILILLLIGFLLTYLRCLYKKRVKYIKILIISLIYIIILMIGSRYILKTYKSISNLSSNSIIYSTSLISLVENKSYKIENISKENIGMINDFKSIDGNEIPKEIIKSKQLKNEIKEYDNYSSLIEALYKKQIDYAFVPTKYVEKLKSIDEEKYKTIDEDTKIIYTKEKEIKQKTNKKNIVKEPFSVLIMGVDSEIENLKKSTFNGDALMLLTFNPKTLNTTILSIPRDSYVPIACFKNNEKNKITHAAIYGEECMINTIENFTGIKIDYYVKINFAGVVNIINSLGGVEVNVPYSFCEQDSKRRFGSHTIYVEEGKRTLNGEEALALSRNRKNNTSKCSSKWTKGYRSDFVRGENQQLVLRAIINKLKEVNNLNEITNLLDKVSNSMETNMSTNQILSLYNIGKDILVKSSNTKLDDLIGFQKLHLSGYDTRIYDERTGLNLYNYVLYNGSIKDVSIAMKNNINKEKTELIKEFKFNINEEYTEKIIGKEDYSSELIKLPNFVGKKETEAIKIASNLGIKYKIKYINSNGISGNVLYQNYKVGTEIEKIDNLILTVIKNNSIQNSSPKNSNEIKEDIDINSITGIDNLN